MKILVTGATGYIGSAVAEVLKGRGHAVFGLVRTPEKAAQLRAAGCEPVLGTLTDLASLRSAAQRADAVIHAAMGWGADTGAIDGAAVETFLKELAGSGRQFVYTSGVWVMGDTQGRLNGEAGPLHPPAMVAWRPAVEDNVLAAGERRVRGVVIRPGMVFGRRGGFLKDFFQSVKEHGAVRIVGTGEYHWSTVHLDDLAELYWRAAEKSDAGQLYIATAGMPQPVKKMALAVALQAGAEGKVESIPLEKARETMGPMADAVTMDIKAGSTKAARMLSWTPKLPSVYEEIAGGSY